MHVLTPRTRKCHELLELSIVLSSQKKLGKGLTIPLAEAVLSLHNRSYYIPQVHLVAFDPSHASQKDSIFACSSKKRVATFIKRKVAGDKIVTALKKKPSLCLLILALIDYWA